MTDDLERLLEQLTPRGSSAGLRERVLNKVALELSRGKSAHRSWWTAAALAASILLALALNLYLVSDHESRLAEIYGPRPVPRQITDIARSVEKVTDKETAASFQRDMLKAARQKQGSVIGQSSYQFAISSGFGEKE